MPRQMDQLDTLALLGRVAHGLEMNVYQARSGEWHAHVSGVRQHELNGLVLRSASISAEGIARRIEKKVQEGADLREELARTRDRYPVREVGSNAWTDVGFCWSEQEARERACEVIGYVMGKRLAQKLGPQEVPARVIPGKKRVTL